MSPKLSKFHSSSEGLPVRVITIDSDAKLSTNEFEDAVNAAAVTAKKKEQEELDEQ